LNPFRIQSNNRTLRLDEYHDSQVTPLPCRIKHLLDRHRLREAPLPACCTDRRYASSDGVVVQGTALVFASPHVRGQSIFRHDQKHIAVGRQRIGWDRDLKIRREGQFHRGLRRGGGFANGGQDLGAARADQGCAAVDHGLRGVRLRTKCFPIRLLPLRKERG